MKIIDRLKIRLGELEVCEQFARAAHIGQKRRDGVTAYIEHPEAVAAGLYAAGEAYEICAVAWLHDVLEDTEATREVMAEAGIPESIIHVVGVLTKRPGQDYQAYLTDVKANTIARRVKIADMLHNLSDQPTDKQIVKYCKGLLFLMEDAP